MTTTSANPGTSSTCAASAHDDPAFTALESAFSSRAEAHCWSVTREQEDVCPVTVFPEGDWEAFLASLGKKDRHEIRRKVRRAEVAGEIRFSLAALDAASADVFIDLHQARWGEQGLFPATEGGDGAAASCTG